MENLTDKEFRELMHDFCVLCVAVVAFIALLFILPFFLSAIA